MIFATKVIEIISPEKLFLTFLPVGIVIFILFKWSLEYKNALYSVTRMLSQLLLIGYLLTYIFHSNNILLIVLILAFMLSAACWISLRTIKIPKSKLFKKVFLSIFLGGGLTFILITQIVLSPQPRYNPSVLIPLAGMIFSYCMMSISLAVERFHAEIQYGKNYTKARNIAFHACMIPITNSFFAVGLVSLPGMMTGQILSGVSPFIAVRYQIMVMCMVYGASGISSAVFLVLIKNQVDLFKCLENKKEK